MRRANILGRAVNSCSNTNGRMAAGVRVGRYDDLSSQLASDKLLIPVAPVLCYPPMGREGGGPGRPNCLGGYGAHVCQIPSS
jgi:hypothetical protein